MVSELGFSPLLPAAAGVPCRAPRESNGRPPSDASRPRLPRQRARPAPALPSTRARASTGRARDRRPRRRLSPPGSASPARLPAAPLAGAGTTQPPDRLSSLVAPRQRLRPPGSRRTRVAPPCPPWPATLLLPSYSQVFPPLAAALSARAAAAPPRAGVAHTPSAAPFPPHPLPTAAGILPCGCAGAGGRGVGD
jgi:hypothetical protein